MPFFADSVLMISEVLLNHAFTLTHSFKSKFFRVMVKVANPIVSIASLNLVRLGPLSARYAMSRAYTLILISTIAISASMLSILVGMDIANSWRDAVSTPGQGLLQKALIYPHQTQNEKHESFAALRNESNRSLHFFVVGFPKAGTTSLLYAFRRHNETAIPNEETCGGGLEHIERALEKLPTPALYGIKCPMALWKGQILRSLVDHDNDVKLIVGLRHPVLLFQSFYNYRVTSMHDKGEIVDAPPAESLIGIENHWKEVSTDLTRYELAFMQLGKVPLSKHTIKILKAKGRGVQINPFRLFLYSIEQLEDQDEKRVNGFRADMQHFLGLKSPIKSFTRENINHFVGKKRHPETIDICESPRFDNLRALLLEQARYTRYWILKSFVKSKHVVIGGSIDHFEDLLSTWTVDPCLN